MDDKVTLAKTVNTWSCLERVSQSILLIGPSHTGRTTFAELIHKYVHGAPTPGLAYDNGKYNLDGVISNKSIKIQTGYPALYEKSRKDKQQLKLVDVPSFIYPPENKKWGLLEQKLTTDMLVERSSKVGFLIFIEEKSTRTNIIPWKKALLNFLDLFRPECLTDDLLLNSIGMAITKAPPEIKEETMVARLKQMKQTLEKQKSSIIGVIDRLINNIIENKRIVIFKKASGDEAEKEAILANWAQLEKMANFAIKKEHIKEQPFQPDGEKAVLEYFNSIDNALTSLAILLKNILKLPDFSADRIKEAKGKRLEGLQDIIVSEEVKQLLAPTTNSKNIKYLNFVKVYAELARQFSNITPSNLEKLIKAIAKLGLFLDPEDQPIFQFVFEGLQFRSIENFTQFMLEPYCRTYADIFSEDVRVEVFKKLALAETDNKKKEFYEEAIQLINDNFSSPPAPLVELQENYNKQLIKFANPKEAIALYVTELGKEKNKAKQFAIVSDIALILHNKGLLGEAGQVYRYGRNAGEALKHLREAAEGDQKFAKEYIGYLAELTLFQQAIVACYDYAARFGYESRDDFHKSLKDVEAARRKYTTEGMKNNSFSQDIDTDGVKKIAIESKQKL